ncbi:MAG: hypothetical protein QCH34_11645 [Methanocalculus sp.]|nr:hypothetical protein [Methanocalculus sp.]
MHVGHNGDVEPSPDAAFSRFVGHFSFFYTLPGRIWLFIHALSMTKPYVNIRWNGLLSTLILPHPKP